MTSKNRKLVSAVCAQCGGEYQRRADMPAQKFCSRRCKADWLIAQPRRHTPGATRRLRDDEPVPDTEPVKYRTSAGYVLLRWKVGVRSYVEALEHRIVTGRVSKEVHHINGIKDDNRPENLMPVTSTQHGAEHATWNIAEACELYQQGWSLPRLQAKYGKDNVQIMRSLKLRGVQMRGSAEHKRQEADVSMVRALFLEGFGRREIAKRAGVGPAVVARVLREIDLRRGPGRVALK